MRLEWSAFAQADREAIFNYIEADSPQAAVTVDDRIRVQVEALMQFPEIGRPGRSTERGSWSSTAHPTSRSIALLTIACGFCVCCTVPSGGPDI